MRTTRSYLLLAYASDPRIILLSKEQDSLVLPGGVLVGDTSELDFLKERVRSVFLDGVGNKIKIDYDIPFEGMNVFGYLPNSKHLPNSASSDARVYLATTEGVWDSLEEKGEIYYKRLDNPIPERGIWLNFSQALRRKLGPMMKKAISDYRSFFMYNFGHRKNPVYASKDNIFYEMTKDYTPNKR